MEFENKKKTFREVLDEIEKKTRELLDSTNYILSILPICTEYGVRSVSGNALNTASEFAMIVIQVAKQFPKSMRLEVIDIFDRSVKYAREEILKSTDTGDDVEEMTKELCDILVEKFGKQPR